ncbi:MAG: ABC transporter substrate-binding protein [Flavobacteriales bacterium]|nr:ABC transporter substrate-binding protein [Flavobacteriales bacterium]
MALKFTDQLNRTIELKGIPSKIISLVPSQTELLYDLGLEQNIVGQTLFCVHPKKNFKNSVKIGGTKKLDLQKIKDLNPDLIIGNKEENEKDQLQELEKDFPLWISDVKDISTAIDMIEKIGKMTGVSDHAESLIAKIQEERYHYKKREIENRTVVYLIWNDPFMAAGNETFIDFMLKEAGFENLVKTGRYPVLSDEELIKLDPDFVFLPNEPFPFKEKHRLQIDGIFRNKRCIKVDGEMFSWYGSRLKLAYGYFEELIGKQDHFKIKPAKGKF